jgi:hypothetical protein
MYLPPVELWHKNDEFSLSLNCTFFCTQTSHDNDFQLLIFSSEFLGTGSALLSRVKLLLAFI